MKRAGPHSRAYGGDKTMIHDSRGSNVLTVPAYGCNSRLENALERIFQIGR
jgi:hypothetical protein